MSDSGDDEETSSPVANKWEDDLLDGGVDDNGDCDAFGKSTFYLNTIKKKSGDLWWSAMTVVRHETRKAEQLIKAADAVDWRQRSAASY